MGKISKLDIELDTSCTTSVANLAVQGIRLKVRRSTDLFTGTHEGIVRAQLVRVQITFEVIATAGADIFAELLGFELPRSVRRCQNGIVVEGACVEKALIVRAKLKASRVTGHGGVHIRESLGDGVSSANSSSGKDAKRKESKCKDDDLHCDGDVVGLCC